MSEQVPSIGRIVHYVLDAGPKQGEHRAAVIVRVWGDKPTSAVNLLVFVDGSNDYYRNQGPEPLIIWRTSKIRSDDFGLDTWHWPEYVPPKE